MTSFFHIAIYFNTNKKKNELYLQYDLEYKYVSVLIFYGVNIFR